MSSKVDQQASEAFYRGLIEGTELGIWVIDAGASTTWVNAPICAMLGYQPSEMLGRHLYDFVDSDGRRMAEWNLGRRQQGIREEHGFRFLKKSGGELWTRIWVHSLHSESGEYRGAVTYVADSSAERARARALEENKALLHAALEQTPAGVIIADSELRVRLANREALAMGIPEGPASPAEVDMTMRHGVRWRVVDTEGSALPPGDLPLTRAIDRGETTVARELVIIPADGAPRSVLVNAAPVLQDGAVTGGVVVFADITQRKRAERERDDLQHGFLQAQKLESLGILAGGIAHDLNNILAVVLGELELALMDLEGHPARERIEKSVSSARVAAALTRQILSYAGQAPLDIKPIDLTALTRELAPLIRAAVARRVRVELSVDAALPSVLADEGQIQQLLLNLVVNAAEAIGSSRGRIRVQAFEATLSAADVRELYPTAPLSPGSYVCLEVTDDGQGMDGETRARLFNPFFSTKAPGRGLGLATALGIIRGHSAGLRVQAEPGRGSTFQIYLPPDHRPVQPVPSPGAEPAGGARVLVVDDEASVRDVFCAALERFGYQPIPADGGAAALALYREQWRTIDLVLMDLTMPGMSGEEACRELLALNPGARILLCSGYAGRHVQRRVTHLGITDFIQKPVRPRDLAQAAHRALHPVVESEP